MKKLYAIFLGLALVLGMATIASAYDLKVTGEFEGIGTVVSGDWEGLDYDVANVYVDLKGAMGDNATGELKVGFDFYRMNAHEAEDNDGDALFAANDWFFVNLAKLTYNVTDGFYLGYQYAERADYQTGHPGYTPDEYVNYGYRFYNGSDGFKHAIDWYIHPWSSLYFPEYGNVFAGFKFDGGLVEAYTDLYPHDASFFVSGSYAADALSIKAWLASYWAGSETYFIGHVGYAFSDVFSLTGMIASIYDGDVFVGVKGSYDFTDIVKLEARLEYDADPFYISDYYGKATLTAFGEVFQPYAEYDKSDGVSIGFDFYMGDSEFYGEYLFDDNELDLGVDIVF